MIPSYLGGLLAGASLIVPIGAQNAFVLRQGILGRQVRTVVGICVLADAGLIALGIAGAGAIVATHPDVLTVLRWGGAAYLAWFGLTTLWQARTPTGLTAAESATGGSVAMTALALTFLNPHVYLDTVVMLGILGSNTGDLRWVFAAGAMTASALWFPGLAILGRRLAPYLARPRMWQLVGVVIAVVMIALAMALVISPLAP